VNNTDVIINFYPEDKNSVPLRGMIKFMVGYMESYLRRYNSSLLFTDISAYITCSVRLAEKLQCFICRTK